MKRLLVVTLIWITLSSCGIIDGRKADPPVEITVLFVNPTPAGQVSTQLVEAIRETVAETNAVYSNSGINISLQIAAIVPVDYDMTDRAQDLIRLVRTDDGYLDEAHTLRDLYEADIVALATEQRGFTINASIMATEATAFVMVSSDVMGAPHYALAHEIGHVQGARHHPENDPLNEPFPDGHGLKTEAFKTIMATGRDVPTLPYFSNPNVTHQNQPVGSAELHNAARVLNETAVYISNFRGTQTPTDFVSPGHWPTFDFGLSGVSPYFENHGKPALHRMFLVMRPEGRDAISGWPIQTGRSPGFRASVGPSLLTDSTSRTWRRPSDNVVLIRDKSCRSHPSIQPREKKSRTTKPIRKTRSDRVLSLRTGHLKNGD